MNTILEQINSAGCRFVEFALPMLVQSAVLMAVLLLADLLLRRKVRAVFRYWLWMLVLLKLILPTTLSSPVSLGSWFGDELATVRFSETHTSARSVNLPQIMETETADVTSTPPADVKPIVPPPPVTEMIVAGADALPVVSPTPLTWQGIVFLIWAAVVAAMGLLLLQRAIFVTGLVAQAQNPTQLMNDAFRFCCRQMGLKGKVGLKVSANTASPAVCGLFRPVILVPENLAPTLGAGHLRTVLLHELAHIKRGDLWINLAQTILQIIYFYNPLLWLANSIIRRIREQAVDEAVQVAMGANAPQYPQTLVDVAKIAFNRPVLSLRLIGVVESKNALKERIKRMLTQPLPKTAKLGTLGLIVLLILAAVLLPMAKAEGDEKGKAGDAAQFIAKLDNGVAVELIGVCEHPSKSKRWWWPDGTALEKAPYVSRKGEPIVNSNEEFNRLIEIAVGFSGSDLQDVSLHCKVPGATRTSTNDVAGQAVSGFLKSIACEISKLFSSGQVNVGVAAGSWETIGVQKADIEEIVEEKVNGGFITWDVPLEKEGKAAIKVAHSFGEYNSRVIAKNRNGNILISPWSSGGGTDALRTTEYRFPAHLAQIDEFQFQIRPYQRVEFKNVSLKPGVKTDVNIMVGDPKASMGDVRGGGQPTQPLGPPLIIHTTPMTFAEDVSPELREIAVTFDQRMMDKSWSWTGGEMYPKTTGQPSYDQNRTTCSLPVSLEPGKIYWVGINSPSHQNFKSANGIPAKQYVILFATKASNGKSTPIPEELITKAKSVNERAEIPYTQEVFGDIQPDGTILFKNTVRQINQSGREITSTGFINSDFVHVTGMSDAKGSPLKFKSTHEKDIYRYKATFNEPVLPGEIMEYTTEGTMDGLVKPVSGSKDAFQYSMTHHPQAGQPTRRVETYLLPAGAELISTTPEDMQRRTKDGRIELHVEKMIPAGGSITTAFQYRLTDIEKIVEQAVMTISTCAETDPRVKESLESLQGLEEQAVVKKVVKFLDSDKNTVRRSAIYILWKGDFKSIELAVPGLQKLCSHEEDFTRGMAALALGAGKVEPAFDTLCNMTLNDSSPYARRCAAYALGLLGRADAKPVLEKALKDSDFNVRNNAEAALTMLSQVEKPKSTK